MLPEERFAAVVTELLGRPGVTPPDGAGKFGGNALKVHGRIFAMLVRGQLVVKLPRKRVDALVDAGEGDRFAPGTGRIMKEWLALSPASTQDWHTLAIEALEFVGAARA